MQPGPLPPGRTAVVATRRRRRHYHFACVLLRGGRCNAPVDDRCGSTTRVFSHGPEQRDARAASAGEPVPVRSLPPRREDFSSVQRARVRRQLSRDRVTGTAVAGRVSRVAKLNLKFKIRLDRKKKINTTYFKCHEQLTHEANIFFFLRKFLEFGK
ncbi:unnamed protein product [Aphis gossypii]|uniref:Uncharacterized protein n=1 Tax=Aphis gossypii TaxID=80765 RepID=A0A9P0JCF3_APHGO|nr:unnamed protein product [Aphis gossypii]